jgi:hypothetical protein
MQSIKPMRWFVYLGVTLLLCACAQAHNDFASSDRIDTGSDAGLSQSPKILNIIDDPPAFEGATVSVKGRFKGWKGDCRGAPPVSRSDWMVDDGTACIYVNGPAPPGLQAMAPDDAPVTITGTVRVSPAGMAYIELAP